MLDHTRYSEGLGAIYPSMMYLIMALDSLGYPADHPDLIAGDPAVRESADRGRGDALLPALLLAGVGHGVSRRSRSGRVGTRRADRLAKAADWLIVREIRHKGDWSVKRPDLPPSGWAFEFENEHYPDIDDTAMVLLALLHAKSPDAAGAGAVRGAGAALADQHAIAGRGLGGVRRR